MSSWAIRQELSPILCLGSEPGQPQIEPEEDGGLGRVAQERGIHRLLSSEAGETLVSFSGWLALDPGAPFSGAPFSAIEILDFGGTQSRPNAAAPAVDSTPIRPPRRRRLYPIPGSPTHIDGP
jgi:hypothetical protein